MWDSPNEPHGTRDTPKWEPFPLQMHQLLARELCRAIAVRERGGGCCGAGTQHSPGAPGSEWARTRGCLHRATATATLLPPRSQP